MGERTTDNQNKKEMMVKLVFNGKLKTVKIFIGLSCAHTVAIFKKSVLLVFLFLLRCVWTKGIKKSLLCRLGG